MTKIERQTLNHRSASKCSHFLNVSEILTIYCCHKNFMMISQTVQELSCWQLNADRNGRYCTISLAFHLLFGPRAASMLLYRLIDWLKTIPASPRYRCAGANEDKGVNVSRWLFHRHVQLRILLHQWRRRWPGRQCDHCNVYGHTGSTTPHRSTTHIEWCRCYQHLHCIWSYNASTDHH